MLTRIAAVMGCAPADDDDLVEAVRLLVAERDEAEAECARLRAYLSDATDDAVGLVESVHRAVEVHQGVVRERDAAEAECARLRATGEAARIYLAAVDARDAAEAAWATAKGGRYAAQEHALTCRGAMRDARTALVKALDIQPIAK